MTEIKLTFEQAVRIRDDFRHLEGEVIHSGGMDRQINRIVVAPCAGPKFNQFTEAYYKHDYEDRDDEENLAASLQPDGYMVCTFYFEVGVFHLHEKIFDTLKEMDIEVDLSKYEIKEND
jgi:hypothetical protein